MSCSRLSSSAFSLIELLVVIAVVAVLSGILIPVVDRVRTKADEVTCLNNLRQIGTAIGLYQANHRGAFPALVESWNADDEGGKRLWFSQFAEYGLPWRGGASLSNMRSQATWYCPACRDYEEQKSWGEPDYGANGEVFANRATTDGSPSGELSGIRLNKPINIENLAQTVAVMETATAGNPYINNTWGSLDNGNFINQPLPAVASETKNGSIAFRHPVQDSLKGTSCNMLFADLHVESVSHEDPRLQTKAGRQKLIYIDD